MFGKGIVKVLMQDSWLLLYSVIAFGITHNHPQNLQFTLASLADYSAKCH